MGKNLIPNVHRYEVLSLIQPFSFRFLVTMVDHFWLCSALLCLALRNSYCHIFIQFQNVSFSSRDQSESPVAVSVATNLKRPLTEELLFDSLTFHDMSIAQCPGRRDDILSTANSPYLLLLFLFESLWGKKKKNWMFWGDRKSVV